MNALAHFLDVCRSKSFSESFRHASNSVVSAIGVTSFGSTRVDEWPDPSPRVQCKECCSPVVEFSPTALLGNTAVPIAHSNGPSRDSLPSGTRPAA